MPDLLGTNAERLINRYSFRNYLLNW